ncbi:MAG TPA: hypothetical protein VNG51_06720 [Ktedonobacteraceae bacterium]|nr:hypothetical protein [Ktedonobacteraceae bacterium]
MIILYEQPRPLREVNPNVSPQLETIVMRAMEKDPTNRYHSPTEFLQALTAATSTVTPVNTLDTASPTVINTTDAWQQQVLPPLPPPVQSHPPLSTPVTPYHAHDLGEPTKLESASQPGTPNPTTPVPQAPMYIPASTPVTPRSGPVVPYATTTPAQQSPYATMQIPAKSAQSRRPIVFAAIIAVLIILIAGISIPLFVSGLLGPHNNQPGGITHGITATAGAKGNYDAIIAGQDELRLIRVDGQDVQTLLCAPAGQSIFSAQWSANEQYVIFDQGAPTGVPPAFLLDLTNGSLRKELIPAGNQGYMPRTWLDHSHVVLTGFIPNSDATQQGLYLLNINNGANQSDSRLQQIANTTSCWSFDTSFDTTTIFTSQCTGDPMFHSGPSTVSMHNINTNASTTLLSNPNVAVTTIRAITPTKLLLLVENAAPASGVDTSQNGLWTVNTDGSGLTRLTTDSDGSQALCPFSQYFWSNVSHDASLYALQGFNPSTNEYKLLFGSTSGGNPTVFADISNGTTLQLAGWTTM